MMLPLASIEDHNQVSRSNRVHGERSKEVRTPQNEHFTFYLARFSVRTDRRTIRRTMKCNVIGVLYNTYKLRYKYLLYLYERHGYNHLKPYKRQNSPTGKVPQIGHKYLRVRTNGQTLINMFYMIYKHSDSTTCTY